MDDDRILKIETKIAYQEKTIRELNDELYEGVQNFVSVTRS